MKVTWDIFVLCVCFRIVDPITTSDIVLGCLFFSLFIFYFLELVSLQKGSGEMKVNNGVFCVFMCVTVQESARRAVENASKYFPGVLCKWGVKGLDEIIHDDSIPGVAVVLAGHTQVPYSLFLSFKSTNRLAHRFFKKHICSWSWQTL